MPFFSELRNLLGLKKDRVETKRAQLQVEKLESEKHGPTLHKPESKDIGVYHPKERTIMHRAGEELKEAEGHPRRVILAAPGPTILSILLALIVALLVGFMLLR